MKGQLPVFAAAAARGARRPCRDWTTRRFRPGNTPSLATTFTLVGGNGKS
jgi:hypothetical protein